MQGGSALFVFGTVDCASGKVGILQMEKVRAILKNVEEYMLLTGSQANSLVNLAAVDAYHEVGILESNDTQGDAHSSALVSQSCGLGRRISIFTKRILRVPCGHFEHQRLVHFEGCAAEPLQTVTAILFGSKWSCLFLRLVLQDALSEVMMWVSVSDAEGFSRTTARFTRKDETRSCQMSRRRF